MGRQISEKKQQERGYLDLLIGLYPDFPNGRIYSGESPDFIVRSRPKRNTGIELTRFTRSDFNTTDSPTYFSPELARDELVKLIQIKEQKLFNYRKKRTDSIWLVILVDGFRTHRLSMSGTR